MRDCGQGRSVSKGILQYDMWGVTPTNLHDWAALKAKIDESVEAYTSNIYTRRVLSGEFQVVNQHLLRDLTELGV